MPPAEFLSFYGLLNFYLYTLAFVYSPSKNALYGKSRGVGVLTRQDSSTGPRQLSPHSQVFSDAGAMILA